MLRYKKPALAAGFLLLVHPEVRMLYPLRGNDRMLTERCLDFLGQYFHERLLLC
jgi:hypothetical protein